MPTADADHLARADRRGKRNRYSTIFGTEILRDAVSAQASTEYWRLLYYINLYRLGLAVFFVTLAASRAQIGSMGEYAPQLFLFVSLVYAVFGLFSIATITNGRPGFGTQARLQFLTDIALITLLMYASGGIMSGLGLLLVVIIAASGVVLGGRVMVFLAALATVLVLLEHGFTVIFERRASAGFVHIGLLGTGLFATAFLIYGLARRMRRTEELAERRGIDLANLGQVNALIIQRMHTGVLLVDGTGEVRLMNDTARDMLGANGGEAPLVAVAPELAAQLERWRRQPGRAMQSVAGRAPGAHLLPRPVALGEGADAGMLVFLEDTTVTEQQAQQMKLAALGRLTAGIAHEIRNPLGAVSHASQLLAESAQLNAQDQRLIHIIGEQSRRMNQIIESVMQLGRRDRLRPATFDLQPWLRNFVTNLQETEHLPADTFRVTGTAITVNMDPDQLRQVLVNLCENAVRHGHGAGAPVELDSGNDTASGRPVLDVIDHGGGIPADIADRVFEPFFTTAAQGTGLGLYIARQLCEGNGGRLDYFPVAGGGSRFRIAFAPGERNVEAGT